MNTKTENTLKKAIDLIKRFDEVATIGLSGSYVEGIQDEYSDFDICIYVRDNIPQPEIREAVYWNFGIDRMIYFDLNLEVMKADGVVIDGLKCGFNWMAIPYVLKFLKNLRRDFDCDEYLPGGLLKTQPLFDPKSNIQKLKSIVPRYSKDRVIYRVRRNIDRAHYAIYGIGWLETAAARNDYYSFLKYKYQVLDNFTTALYALNCKWFCDEKRLLNKIKTFEFVPENCSEKLESIIMHRRENTNLVQCLASIKKLFEDLSKIANEKYPDLALDMVWE